ncbi:MAG: hypothetical protein Q9221_007471 [Calogaya cf. arnoldii]
MPAPVQDADMSDASSPPHRKSNAWPKEERDDIYNRRQKGEKWDTICLGYPDRSKHAMQQQYSDTPTKGKGRRKGKPSAPTSPAVMPNSVKKVSKRKASPENADEESDSDSDRESIPSAPTKPIGGNDGAPEMETDSESTKGPDSARKQRLRRRKDEDEQSVSTRPRRSRASGVNYSLLQNSGYGLDDQADEVGVEATPDVPVRKSKIVALKMGTPKTPVADEAGKRRKSPSVNVDDESMHEDNSTRRSQRVKKVVNKKNGNLTSPLSHTAPEDLHLPGGKRKRRSLLAAEPDEDDSDARATRSKKRKTSEPENNKAHPEKEAAKESGQEEIPFRNRKRQARPKEHLGFLSNGQPRLRRRRVKMEEAERAERETPKTASVSRRRSRYQFPFLEGYNGPPPPDMAAILARQEEHERQNPPPQSGSESEAESTSSSLQSLNDDEEDVIMEVQPQNTNATALDEAVSPLTRTNMDEQLPAPVSTTAVVEQTSSGEVPASAKEVPTSSGKVPTSSGEVPTSTGEVPTSSGEIPTSTLDFNFGIPDVVFFPEDLERARQNASKLRALNNEKLTATIEKSTAIFSDRLVKDQLCIRDLKQELQDLRKVHGSCESKAKDAKAVAQQLKGLKEISNLYDEALEKSTASETALAEEKKRNVELEEELSGSRTESLLREKNLESQITELTKHVASRKQSSNSEEIDKLKADHEKELQYANDLAETRKAQNDKLREDLKQQERDLRGEITRQNSKLAEIMKENEELLNERSAENLKLTTITTKDGPADTTPTRTPTKLPSPAALFDFVTGRGLATTIPITTLKPHLEQIRKSHVSIGYNLKTTSDMHTVHDAALSTLHEKLEDGDISMNNVRVRVKELVAGSSKVGKGLKTVTESSETAKGRFYGLSDVVEPPS